MAPRIRFPASDIPVEGTAMDVELSPEWLATTLNGNEVNVGRITGVTPGRLRGRLSRSGSDIVVRGRLRAALEVACVRCLEPAAVAVDADLSLLLQPQSRKGGGRNAGRRGHDDEAIEHEFQASDADKDVYDGETVVLDGFVRELILLEIPSFPLCDDACPGIAPSGGHAEPEMPAVDPRLAPLSAFRQKSDGPVTIEDLVAAAAERSSALGRKPVLKANRAGRVRKKRGKG